MTEEILALCLLDKEFSLFNKDRLDCKCPSSLFAIDALENSDFINYDASLFIKDKTGIELKVEREAKYSLFNLFKTPYYAEIEIPEKVVFTISPSSSFYKYDIILGQPNKGVASFTTTFGVTDPDDPNKIILNGWQIRNFLSSGFAKQSGNSIFRPFEIGQKSYLRIKLDESSYGATYHNTVSLAEYFEGISNNPAFQNVFKVLNSYESEYTDYGIDSMYGIHKLKNNLNDYKFLVKNGDVWIDKTFEIVFDEDDFLGTWNYYGEDTYTEWKIIDDVDERVVKGGMLE